MDHYIWVVDSKKLGAFNPDGLTLKIDILRFAVNDTISFVGRCIGTNHIDTTLKCLEHVSSVDEVDQYCKQNNLNLLLSWENDFSVEYLAFSKD